MDDKGILGPRLVGTTGALYQGSVLESFPREQKDNHAFQMFNQSNYFKSSQW